jgi:N-acetylglucosamine-6-phosphate deacetylase
MAASDLIVEGGRAPLAGELQPVHVEVAGTTIASVDFAGVKPDPAHQDRAAVLDAGGCALLPGFIDVHVHGAAGADTMDADPAALAQMARFFSRHGVTAFLATTMTAGPAPTLAAVQAVAAAGERPHPNGAAILGVHLEGPYISPRFPGAQAVSSIRPPNLVEFNTLCAAGPVRMITLAPEMPGALELVRRARHEGIVVVAGHTAATYAECEAGIAAGVNQATHTYNAMSGLHHREPGTLGSVLSNDRVFAQLIADNVHVHPAAMKILARCKSITRTMLITDAIRAVGLPAGQYDLGGQTVTVTSGAGGQPGECRLADGTLAGSVLTLERGLLNFGAAAGLSLAETWPAASLTPAMALGLEQRRGKLATGYLADLVLLDEAGEVAATVNQGRVVYLRDAGRLRSNRGDHDPDGPGSL